MQVDDSLLAESGWLGETQTLAPAKCTQDPTSHYFLTPAAVLRAPLILPSILMEFRACLFRHIQVPREDTSTCFPNSWSSGSICVPVVFVSQEDACWFAGMQHGIQAETLVPCALERAS